MSRRSDRKSTPDSNHANLSRRSFIERVAGAGVTAPALMTLTGSWLMADEAFAQKNKASNGHKGSSAGSESSYSSSAESSYSGSSTSGPPAILHATADSTLRHDSPNTNEGANPFLRVGVRPLRRAIVQFEESIVDQMRAEAMTGTVYLTLHIASNSNNWSQDDQSYVDVHPLPPNFWVNEGNGASTGLPLSQVYKGDGAGVTWNLANDTNTTDAKGTAKGGKVKKAPQQNWAGGSLLMGDPTSPGVLHENGLTGQVSWNVTEDLLRGANAWIVKVRDEDEPSQTGERRQAGYDPFRGSVDYYSKEGADLAACQFPPQLQLYTTNSCPAGEAPTGEDPGGQVSSGGQGSSSRSTAVSGEIPTPE